MCIVALLLKRINWIDWLIGIGCQDMLFISPLSKLINTIEQIREQANRNKNGMVMPKHIELIYC